MSKFVDLLLKSCVVASVGGSIAGAYIDGKHNNPREMIMPPAFIIGALAGLTYPISVPLYLAFYYGDKQQNKHD